MFTLMIGAGFWGVVLALIINYIFDIFRKQKIIWFTDHQEQRELFFSTMFEVMGHLTKSKGRVTEADIYTANRVMDDVNLYGESREAAHDAFRFGKSDNYPLRDKIRQFRNICFGRFDLIRIFLETQIQAAFADGSLHPNERAILYIIAEELGVSRNQFDQFLFMMHRNTKFSDNDQYQYKSNNGYHETYYTTKLKDAYRILGVNSTDSPTVIKRAYRNLMSEHHPDKLIAKGLSKEIIEIEKQKTQEIQKAYNLIKSLRKFK